MKMKRLLERVEYYHVQLAGEKSEDMSAFLSMVKDDEIDTAHDHIAKQTSESIADALRATFEADQKRNSKY